MKHIQETEPSVRAARRKEKRQREEALERREAMTDIVERLWTLVRHGRDQGMKMNDVEDAAREIERLRAENGRLKASPRILNSNPNSFM